jgi:hypothetical protein
MSTAKKLGIAAAIIFAIWVVNDPVGAAGTTGDIKEEVETGLDSIPVFLTNVLN